MLDQLLSPFMLAESDHPGLFIIFNVFFLLAFVLQHVFVHKYIRKYIKFYNTIPNKTVTYSE